MSWIVIAVVSLLSGLLGSLGMGAGAVLLLYLRVFGGVEQFEAQGINLIFFLPIAVLSILLHAGVCILAGLPAVFLGVWLGGLAGGPLLSKLFAGLLLIIGVRELFQKDTGSQPAEHS